jgi:hypothetical protein
MSYRVAAAARRLFSGSDFAIDWGVDFGGEVDNSRHFCLLGRIFRVGRFHFNFFGVLGGVFV